MRRLVPLLLLLAAALTGCGGDDAAPGPGAGGGDGDEDGTVTVRVADLEVTAEVADDDAERATGLMGREEVPEGTGMVFLYDAPVEGQFYMYRVPVPLTATFARDGVVVGVVEMEPCGSQDPAECERYGPGEPFDTVLETSPETVAGHVLVGDPMVVERS